MSAPQIAVRVASDGTLSLRNWTTRAQCNPTARVDLSGLDGRVLRLFERWMTLRDRSWDWEEVRIFGQLLHRTLFPGDSWRWVERQAAPGHDRVRLMLAFPADQAASRLASLPWEYLCAPDRPGRAGQFLVLEPWLVLSRVVPSGALEYPDGDMSRDPVRVLPVVGEADNRRLGAVDYEPVLTAIRRTGQARGFRILDPVVGATARRLREVVSDPVDGRPHIVHFLGHGRFREGRGAVALCDGAGETDWVEEHRLAEALCSPDWAPSLVLLHACEGGAIEFEERFAGLAPALAQGGTRCVIGMQYAVTNAAAVTFSTAVYRSMAAQRSLDEAVQDGRRELWEETHDPRLLGVPMLYQNTAQPLFEVPTGKGD